MYEYESPISLTFLDPVIQDLRDRTDAYVLECVQKVGCHVNKEELVKALQYDRDQYDRGYQHGYYKGQMSMPSATWGEWQQLPDDYNWNVWRCSACSEEFVLEEGTPKENGYKFCPHCGATMVMEDEQYDFGFEEDDDDA